MIKEEPSSSRHMSRFWWWFFYEEISPFPISLGCAVGTAQCQSSYDIAYLTKLKLPIETCNDSKKKFS